MSLQERIDALNFQINQLDEKRESLLAEVKRLTHAQDIVEMTLEDDTRAIMIAEIERVQQLSPAQLRKEREFKKKRFP